VHSICTSDVWVMHMVTARIKMNEYTNKVLNVVKAKYGLKDKSEALDTFANMYGDEFVEREVKDEYVQKIIKMFRDHKKKHGDRTMTLKELDELCGVK
jgi:hypothetical protein